MYKISLVGGKDIIEFNQIMGKIEGRVELLNKERDFIVDAKSYLSCLLAATEWGGTFWVRVASGEDIYSKIEKWIVVGEDDGNYIHE